MRIQTAVVYISLALPIGACEDPANESFEDAIADVEENEREQFSIEENFDLDQNEKDLTSVPPPPQAFWAQNPCSTSGGGTWGSILRLCVSINGGQGTFTITKKDGTKFTSSGDFYLKRDSWQTGPVHGEYHFFGGAASYYVKRFFQDSEYVSGSRFYYAYVTSDQGGYSYVGPVKINK